MCTNSSRISQKLKKKKSTGGVLDKGILAFYFTYLLTCFYLFLFTSLNLKYKHKGREREENMYFRKNILVQKYFNIARNNERSARLCDLHTAPTLISISSLSKIISEAIFQWFKPGFKWFFHTLLGFSVSFLFWCTLHSSSRIIQVLRCTPPQVLFWLHVPLLLKNYSGCKNIHSTLHSRIFI